MTQLSFQSDEMNEPYISRLPPESLSEIFSFCLQAGYTPLFLGKVCATWRNIVWSTPALWSLVVLRLSRTRFNAQLKLLDEWLARSGSCPLSICIVTGGRVLWNKYSPVDVIRTVAPYTTRWRHIDLALPISCLRDLEHRKGQFPLLASIAITNQPDSFDDGNEPATPIMNLIDVFGTAPQLCDIILWYPRSPLQLSFPWQQLTHFTGKNFNIENCMDVLRRTPNLTHCSFIDIFAREATDLVSHPILLPHLASLAISDSSPDVVSVILQIVTAPTLWGLVATTRNRFLPYVDFFEFLQRSSCYLQRLQLWEIDFTNPQLFECLQYMSDSLISLDLYIWDYNSEPNDNLIVERLVLPKMKSFTIRYGGLAPERGKILDLISLPSVEHISLRGQSHIEVFSHAPFLAFLTQSSQSLQYLSLDNLLIPAPLLSEHLRCIPSLIKLKITKSKGNRYHAYCMQDDIIPLLTAEYPNPILPNLEIFEYRDTPCFDGDQLVNMLSSRWRGRCGIDGDDTEHDIARLGFVTITTRWERELNERAVSQLRVLIGEGMKISLRRSNGTRYFRA